jgi:putative exporter of polyketide antibiotics
MRVNLENASSTMSTIPTVILLPHTYSAVPIIARRRINFLFFSPAYLAVSCLLAYAIYQFCPGLFPSLGNCVTSPKNKIFLFLYAGNLFSFLANSNLEIFFHLWQFQISNLIIVFNYCDCWE